MSKPFSNIARTRLFAGANALVALALLIVLAATLADSESAAAGAIGTATAGGRAGRRLRRR